MAKVITTELQHSGASGANITLDSSKNVTCENNLTVDGTTTLTGAVTLPAGTTSDTLSFRNKFQNGACTVNQRGNSTGITSSGYYGPDRWRTNFSSCGTWSISQDTESPDGFGYSYKLDCTTADASPAASDEVSLNIRLEGLDLQDLAYGTSAAKSTTVSFWVRCTKTGNFQVNLKNNDRNRICGGTATISSANTWEKKTITYPGDTTGSQVIDNDNASAFQIEMYFDGGSDLKGGTTPSAWEARVNTDRAANTTLALADNTANILYMTGLQFEVGSTATDFEHRPYSDELARCKRYCYVMKGDANAITGIVGSLSGNEGLFSYRLPVAMRTTPTFSASGSWRVNVSTGNGSDQTSDLAGANYTTTYDAGWLQLSSISIANGVNGSGILLQMRSSGTTFTWVAEL